MQKLLKVCNFIVYMVWRILEKNFFYSHSSLKAHVSNTELLLQRKIMDSLSMASNFCSHFCVTICSLLSFEGFHFLAFPTIVEFHEAKSQVKHSLRLGAQTELLYWNRKIFFAIITTLLHSLDNKLFLIANCSQLLTINTA